MFLKAFFLAIVPDGRDERSIQTSIVPVFQPGYHAHTAQIVTRFKACISILPPTNCFYAILREKLLWINPIFSVYYWLIHTTARLCIVLLFHVADWVIEDYLFWLSGS